MDSQQIIETMEWMVKTFIWQHQQSGLGGSYSPELQKAIALLDELKSERELLTVYGKSGD